MARTFFRFEQERFIGFRYPGQMFWRRVPEARQKTMAPEETGVAMDADDVGGLAYARCVKHTIEVIEPAWTLPLPQPGQRRARQRIEGLAATAAAVALQAMRIAVPIQRSAGAVPAQCGQVERAVAIAAITSTVLLPLAACNISKTRSR